jgi:hypothetical protein
MILKWGEDQQDKGSNVQESPGKRMFNGNSESTTKKPQGKCHNNFIQNLESDIVQNIRSDRTQSALSDTVQSLDCRFSALNKTLSEMNQIRIENNTTSEQPSMDITCSINRKRVKKLPKTRSDDFLWT